MTNIFVLDPGFGARKFVGSKGGVQIPSQVAMVRGKVITEMMGVSSAEPPLKIGDIDGREYFIGAGAHSWGTPVENMSYQSLVDTPEALAMFYAALSQYQKLYGKLAKRITLGLTLPHEMLSFDDQNEKRNRINAIKRVYGGVHQWWTNGEIQSIEVEKVVITSQAVAAYFDYITDRSGKVIKENVPARGSEFGVISLGHNTLELFVARIVGSQMEAVHSLTSGHSQAGVSAMLRHCDRRGHYSLGELDTLLRHGDLDTAGALPIWLSQVQGIIKREWPHAERYAAVSLVGGGALLLNGQLSTLFKGKAHTPEDPIFAVANGLYKQLARKA